MNDGGHKDVEPIRLEGFATKDLYQKREKIFTRFVGGPFQKLRFFSGLPLLAGYFLLPWLTWNDRPIVLFDLAARQFHILSITFWPQDLWLLGWLLMLAAFALFTVTAFVGRLWCGYSCPQTIWTAIFMWIEQITEGSRHQRIRLDNAPWTLTKITKRSAKHALWLGFAFATGITFVFYFTPARDFFNALVSGAVGPYLLSWTGFWTLFFTAATYINAGWMREQVCIYMCPYARFQSAMIDDNTLIVSYDEARGEPRGSRKHNESCGDCVDCTMCVQVCPTGIDIREGLQYECIGCAHCIDACNQVMAQLDRPKALIRYTTSNKLRGQEHPKMHLRAVAYAVVCAALGTSFMFALAARVPFEFDLLRDRDHLYNTIAGDKIINDLQLIVMNKSQNTGHYVAKVLQPDWLSVDSSAVMRLDAGEVGNFDLRLTAGDRPKNTRRSSGLNRSEALLQLCQTESQQCIIESTQFLMPSPLDSDLDS